MAATLIAVLVICVTTLSKTESKTTEFSYVDHVFHPLELIEDKIQFQNEFTALLQSQEFWDFTEQINIKRSVLRKAALTKNSTASANGTESKPTPAVGNGLFNFIGSLFGNGNTSSPNISLAAAQLGQIIGGGISQLLAPLLSGPTPTNSSHQNDTVTVDIIKTTPSVPHLSSKPSNGGFLQSIENIVSNFLPKSNVTPSEEIFGGIRDAISESNTSDTCKQDAIMVAYGLQTQQPWALKMFDASAKIPTDLLNFDIVWSGSYDECYKEDAVAGLFLHPSVYLPAVKPRYCTVQVQLPFPGLPKSALTSSSLQIGTCLPKSCSTQDTTILANLLLKSLPLGNISLSASFATCPPTPDEVPYETKDIAMIVLMSVLGFIIVAGTAYEIIAIEIPKFVNSRKETHNDTFPTTVDKNGTTNGNIYTLKGSAESPPAFNDKTVNIQMSKEKKGDTREKKNIITRILLAFSVYSNGKKILSTSQPKGTLSAVNGIRFLSMSWVILGHTLGTGIGVSRNAAKYGQEFLQRASSQAIANALVSVDTFFVLSGLLTTYLLLKEMKKSKGRINWFLFYFHRYWRLTPMYMLVIGLYTTLLNHVIFGPLRPSVSPGTKCDEYWWMNLLYINNFVDKPEDLCLAWSWYLNNDMQFYVLSPLMIVPLFFKELIGVIISVAFLLAVTIASGVISFVYKMPPTPVGGGDASTDPSHYFALYYMRPYCRMGPYVCGVLTGYILYKTKNKCRINIYLNFFGWAIATSCACAVLYGLYGALKGDDLLNVEESAVYNALHRSVWGAAVCWVIFACATGNGGFINTILSWKVFVPLSRLSYAAYLIHLIIIYAYFLSRRMPIYMTDLELVYLFLSNLVVSYGAAFVVSLLFESPFMALEKVIFPSRNRK
ncbi:nose resistant to fluoxetine protein 6-like [Saccostrea echinata]|uniref:nose resistant to fluoxetine protein 6-like n=1 Tax=Saccostrea echinata TaxID=191078 RepID=UPI002A829FFB|nr:nose resistant to fluoxetine protein 6-like [Saccostrea echinata]